MHSFSALLPAVMAAGSAALPACPLDDGVLAPDGGPGGQVQQHGQPAAQQAVERAALEQQAPAALAGCPARTSAHSTTLEAQRR